MKIYHVMKISLHENFQIYGISLKSLKYSLRTSLYQLNMPPPTLLYDVCCYNVSFLQYIGVLVNGRLFTRTQMAS